MGLHVKHPGASLKVQDGEIHRDQAKSYFPILGKTVLLVSSPACKELRTRKMLNRLKINNSFYIHQRSEITGQIFVPKIEEGEADGENHSLLDHEPKAEHSAGNST